MSDAILEVAAYVCLALGVALLVARLFGERIKRAAGVLRFRLTLRKLDGVPAEWTRAMGAMEHLQERARPAQSVRAQPAASTHRRSSGRAEPRLEPAATPSSSRLGLTRA